MTDWKLSCYLSLTNFPFHTMFSSLTTLAEFRCKSAFIKIMHRLGHIGRYLACSSWQDEQITEH
jgi:hypothetical protein